MLHVYTHVVTRSIAAEIVDFPQVPFALPNDSWLIQAQAVLPKRPTHVLAADPTLLDFPARDDHPWPALTTIRWKDRANAINTAGGASSVANRNDNHAAIITAVLCFTMLLAALIVVAWVQHRRRRSASSVSRVKMLGSELTEEVVKEALGHGVRMLVRIPPPPDFPLLISSFLATSGGRRMYLPPSPLTSPAPSGAATPCMRGVHILRILTYRAPNCTRGSNLVDQSWCIQSMYMAAAQRCCRGALCAIPVLEIHTHERSNSLEAVVGGVWDRPLLWLGG